MIYPRSFINFLQVSDSSWDQKYRCRMWFTVIVGKVNDILAAIKRGSLCVSRWNTLWSRDFMLYFIKFHYTLKLIIQPDYQLRVFLT